MTVLPHHDVFDHDPLSRDDGDQDDRPKGLSIETLAAAALAFASVPRKPKRYGGRRCGAATRKPRLGPQEPQQGELLEGQEKRWKQNPAT